MTNIKEIIQAAIDAFDLIHSDLIGTNDFDEDKWEEQKRDVLTILLRQEPDNVLNIEPQIACIEGICPYCRRWINTIYNRKFCGYCGQALKWSEK